MNPKEFIYWLDGALTLNEKNELNQAQTSALKTQLSKVDTSGTDKSAKLCTWFKGYFDMVEPIILEAQVLIKVKEKIEITLSNKEQSPLMEPHHLSPDFQVRC